MEEKMDFKPSSESLKKPYQKPGIVSTISFHELVAMYIAIVGFSEPGKFPTQKTTYSFFSFVKINIIVTTIFILTLQNTQNRIINPKIPELINSNSLH